MKKRILPYGIILTVIFSSHVFFASNSIRIGMHKTEVLRVLDSYNISAIRSIVAGDTLISIMPKNGNTNRPNRKYLLVFRQDIVQKFEPYRVKHKSDYTHIKPR